MDICDIVTKVELGMIVELLCKEAGRQNRSYRQRELQEWTRAWGKAGKRRDGLTASQETTPSSITGIQRIGGQRPSRCPSNTGQSQKDSAQWCDIFSIENPGNLGWALMADGVSNPSRRPSFIKSTLLAKKSSILRSQNWFEG